MKTSTYSKSIALGFLALAFAPWTVAQVTGSGSVGGALQGGAQIGPGPAVPAPGPSTPSPIIPPATPPAEPVLPPPSPVVPSVDSVATPPAGTVSAGTTASGSASVNAGNGTISGSTTTTAGAAATPDSSLFPTGRMSVNELAELGASGSLDSTATLSRIRSSNMNTRTEVLGDLSNRLTASGQAIRQLEQEAVHLGTPLRQEFNSAMEDLRTKERALNTSLGTARNSANEAWMGARSKLESDYDAYARAVLRVEAAAGKPSPNSVQPRAAAEKSSSSTGTNPNMQ